MQMLRKMLREYSSIALYFNLIVYLLQKCMDGLYVMLFGCVLMALNFIPTGPSPLTPWLHRFVFTASILFTMHAKGIYQQIHRVLQLLLDLVIQSKVIYVSGMLV